jgi:hypothetical protein
MYAATYPHSQLLQEDCNLDGEAVPTAQARDVLRSVRLTCQAPTVAVEGTERNSLISGLPETRTVTVSLSGAERVRKAVTH